MLVTIRLDSGGFMTDECANQTWLDVGCFETSGPTDIEIREGRQLVQPPPNIKLGKRDTIDVQHLTADGKLNIGVSLSASFRDILKKRELYPANTPNFLPQAYDCILHFQSGEFEGSDPKIANFHECRVSDDQITGISRQTRLIPHDVLVRFDLAKDEQLRLRRADGTDLWAIRSADAGTKEVEVKILADQSTDSKYFKHALSIRGPHYFRPNPDPPPMNGN
jgi:hypothetical protein